jgi:hypothetical protein
MNIGQDGVTEILADIPSVCGRSRGRMTGETIIQFCAAGLAAA